MFEPAHSLTMVVSLVYLGRLDYGRPWPCSSSLRLTEEDQHRRQLLLVEHPPVFTLGRNSHREHIVASAAFLARRGISFETNRGGDVTYHGPGQLVGYPILDLRGFTPPLGVVEYLRRLEEVLIRACADFGMLTQRAPGRTGVWTIPGGTFRRRRLPLSACTSPAG